MVLADQPYGVCLSFKNGCVCHSVVMAASEEAAFGIAMKSYFAPKESDAATNDMKKHHLIWYSVISVADEVKRVANVENEKFLTD